MRRLMWLGLTMCMVENAAAQSADSAAFIIRLGRDTTVIERYVRTGNQLIAEAVQRSPTTTLHRLALTFDANGAVTMSDYTMRRPGESTPATRRVVRFAAGTATVEVTQGANPVNRTTQPVSVAAPIPITGPFYTPYELAIMRAVAGGASAGTAHVLPAGQPVAINVQRVGSDSVTLNNQFGEAMRAHIDARGRLLHLHTPAFTTVERRRWVDLDALAREFASRDATGRGMGPLSPRMTARRVVDGANLWIDYGRPGMRGRPVWGALVPWDRVWRMGANDAAHFATDRTIRIGDLTVAPGTYTLFLLPGANNNWQLIVNRATGMSGLDYDPAQDVGRVPLRVSAAAQPAESFTLDVVRAADGTVLVVSWDRLSASVPIHVQPR